VCFSVSMIFRVLAIFQVLLWIFLIWSFFRFPLHISRPTVCVSHFPHFQLSFHIAGPTVCIYRFSCFNISRHISLPKECYSHFPCFSVFSPYSRSYSVHLLFFMFFNISGHISLQK
jgi:hypothetical protein